MKSKVGLIKHIGYQWLIPHVPSHPNLIITVCKNQHAGQVDRLVFFPPLSQASTAKDFTRELTKLLLEKSDNSAINKRKADFKTILFGGHIKNGAYIPGLLAVKEANEIIRRIKNGIQNKLKFTGLFTKTRLKKLVAVDTTNRAIFRKALQNFDAKKKTVLLDSNGKKIMGNKPDRTYTNLPAIKVDSTWFPLGRIKKLANIYKQKKFSNISQYQDKTKINQFFDKLAIPIHKLTIQEIDKILRTKATTRLFNNSGMHINAIRDAYTKKEVVKVNYFKTLKIDKKQTIINPSTMRHIFEQLFSIVGRGGGSRLAGTPLAVLDELSKGIKIRDLSNFPKAIHKKYYYGNHKGESMFALSPRKIIIGQPYAERIQKASILVTQAIDVVSRKLDEYITQQYMLGKKTVKVEEIIDYASTHITEWVSNRSSLVYDGPRSRTHQQLDFFFVPTLSTRKILIEEARKNNGILSKDTISLLRKETTLGNLKLAIIDISGGAGGTGIAESVAEIAGFKSSGHFDAYIKSLVAAYESRIGRKPKTIVVSPRKEDLTLVALEYIPCVERLRRQGFQADIVLSEQLDDALEQYNGNKPFEVTTWDGKKIVPELIAKRFTFLGEGRRKEGDRGYIRTVTPPGVLIVPSPVSRIPASDKRINSAILAALSPQLAQLGVKSIPTAIFPIINRSVMESFDTQITESQTYIKDNIEKIVEKIIQFAKINIKDYPEIGFLGLVLKVNDKHPGREGKGGEIVSAYPISAGICNTKIFSTPILQFIHNTLFYRIYDLVKKGVSAVVVQPNVFSIFASGQDFMEVNILVYSHPKKEDVWEQK